jgi:predicted short-subunit dehydrogenase-like oxidoreductase (DUF2520 family)
VTEIGLIGPGRVGRALATFLPAEKYTIGPILSSTLTSARRATRLMERGEPTENPEAFASSDVILVTVPDCAIAVVADRLAQLPFSLTRKTVLHTSGLCDSSDLAAPAKRGAAVGSMHPLCIFQRPLLSFAGVHFAVEGDSTATNTARKLIRDLDGEFQLVSAEQKIHHCIAKSIASDLLTGLIEQAVSEMVAGGFSRRRGLQAVIRVLEDATADFGRSSRNSRPGPLLQGDTEGLRNCLEDLARLDPYTAREYRRAAIHTLQVLQKGGEHYSFLNEKREIDAGAPGSDGRRSKGAPA